MQNCYNFLILFFHSETNLKVLLAQLGVDPRPLGLGAPRPWPIHHRANCWTATLYSFYLIGFFHSETNIKELAVQPGIHPRPSAIEHHWGPRLGIDSRFLGFEHHSLDHYTTMARGAAENRAWPFNLEYHSLARYFIVAVTFLFYLILFSTLEPT